MLLVCIWITINFIILTITNNFSFAKFIFWYWYTSAISYIINIAFNIMRWENVLKILINDSICNDNKFFWYLMITYANEFFLSMIFILDGKKFNILAWIYLYKIEWLYYLNLYKIILAVELIINTQNILQKTFSLLFLLQSFNS